jgi:5-methylcytosine-specific restriction enzyme A
VPFGRLCPDCGIIVVDAPVDGRCPEHAAAHLARDNQRRATKQRAHGRNSRHWRRLCARAKELQPWCSLCGRRRKLTVHLRPECGTDHARATLDQVVVLCVWCHGDVDGGRAHA